jgi:hypothetical protein
MFKLLYIKVGWLIVKTLYHSSYIICIKILDNEKLGNYICSIQHAYALHLIKLEHQSK